MDSTTPRGSTLHRFKWSFKNERSTAGGRGSIRIAAPDSLRMDVAGPLGAGRAAGVVIGDSAVWVEPEKSLNDLVPSYPLLWAMTGVARRPGEAAELRGLTEARRVYLQYVDGADTVEYLRELSSPARFLAEVRHAGKVVGRVETKLDASGQPVSSRLTVPSEPAQLDLNFYLHSSSNAFPPDTWRRREP
ncbi:MAG TPA: hypothetical protein VMJ30_02620 [Gemmatimonadales bacterium]|nr:hypothetical protein [Gemmatimonadales bacterium]